MVRCITAAASAADTSRIAGDARHAAAVTVPTDSPEAAETTETIRAARASDASSKLPLLLLSSFVLERCTTALSKLPFGPLSASLPLTPPLAAVERGGDDGGRGRSRVGEAAKAAEEAAAAKAAEEAAAKAAEEEALCNADAGLGCTGLGAAALVHAALAGRRPPGPASLAPASLRVACNPSCAARIGLGCLGGGCRAYDEMTGAGVGCTSTGALAVGTGDAGCRAPTLGGVASRSSLCSSRICAIAWTTLGCSGREAPSAPGGCDGCDARAAAREAEFIGTCAAVGVGAALAPRCRAGVTAVTAILLVALDAVDDATRFSSSPISPICADSRFTRSSSL